MTERPSISTARWIAAETSPEVVARPHLLDPGEKRGLGHVEELTRLRADRAHRHRHRGIGNPAVLDHADVDREDIAPLQLVGAGNSVHHHRVGRGADRAGETAVSLEGRLGVLRADELLGRRVELPGGDSRPGLRLEHLQAADEDVPGHSHLLDLLRSLANDHPVHARRPRRAPGASSPGSCGSPRPPRPAPPCPRSGAERCAGRSSRPAARSCRGTWSRRWRITSGLSSSRTIKPAAVEVADSLLLGRVELDVEDVAALGAGAPPTEPADDLVVGDVDQQHRVDDPAQLRQLGVECLGLGHGARKAVEDEAVERLRGVDPLDDHADDHLVGDQVAAIHVLLRGPAQLGLVAHRGTEDVAGGVVGQAQVFLQPLALGALSRPGRAEEH